MKAAEALAQAQNIIQQRGESYGNVRANMTETAKRMSLTMGCTVTPATVCLLMLDLKLARLRETPTHLDSIFDIMGYASLLAEIVSTSPNRDDLFT
jgi:hypothetical protein